MNQTRFYYSFILMLIPFLSRGQDTIYSTPYPNGVITKTLDANVTGYRFYPVDNPGLVIVVSKRETLKINYGSGERFLNEDYKPSDVIVLSTEASSGKIYYSAVMEFKGASEKKLFHAIKTLPQGVIKYSLVSSDEAEFTYQKYTGTFLTKFQGDPYHVYFNLLIKFKEGRIKYEYSDFVAVFEKANTKLNSNPFAGGINTINRDHMKTLDQLYARAARNSDQTKFWIPIKNAINQSIESIKKQCEGEAEGKNDW